ncbi:MAG: KpsF/GutQ family sugar-phosphate isomerase [Alphaproteobacteria bacterium PRO2]|nr:KpsF/GutQ family sugar-phosphate isomerase [Alphaproteobacteria bacterium PRO2]
MKAAKPEQKNSPDIAAARRVLETEIDGLQKLAASIDDNFTAAVTAIHAMKDGLHAGRLIVAGIGKSGHVARKIAATLASTGTPAYYIHPGEASHGDLGMITDKDVVLMLSNSGENPELSDLIHYTRRYGLTLIAITSNEASTLAKHSDILLQLPKAPEACPNGLAPTTSTTMMLALGDALAVALLDRMGLTREQYKVFHPGGKLGRKLMKVSELMVKLDDMPLVNETAKMDEAILVLTGKNLGAAVVVDKNKKLKGIITDGDLKRHMSDDLLKKPVTDIMTTSPKSIGPDALAAEALDMMTKEKGRYLTSLLVMDSGKLVGMIRLQDCLQAGIV